MKNYGLIILLLIMNSCGGAGHIHYYDFIAPKSEVKKNLVKVIEDKSHIAPTHWNNYEQGADSQEDIFVYFDSNPKEIYFISFNNYEGTQYQNKTVLALVGAFDGKLWHFARDLSWSEETRIEDRFEKDILGDFKNSYSKR